MHKELHISLLACTVMVSFWFVVLIHVCFMTLNPTASSSTSTTLSDTSGSKLMHAMWVPYTFELSLLAAWTAKNSLGLVRMVFSSSSLATDNEGGMSKTVKAIRGTLIK